MDPNRRMSRSPDDDENPQSLLFIHQTAWQKRLLRRYGNEMCLMDATYNTTSYDLPLFFICVNTNVGFTIVASFLVGKENKRNIAEALEMLVKWNPDWSPSHFLCDFDHREINAIETTFQACMVYICDFHREQAWDRWLSKIRHGVAEKKVEILAMLRSVARSTTNEDFEEAVAVLRNAEVVQSSPNLTNWIEGTWLKEHKRWVKAFRIELVNNRMTTTNGLERQHRELKENYLKRHAKGKTLTGMIDVLVKAFLPDAIRRYMRYNVESLECYRAYAENIPMFLRNRPKRFVSHCMARMAPASDEIGKRHITQCQGESDFKVISPNSGVTYYMKLSDVMPSCTCPDWQRTHWPCKHMLAVFLAFPAHGWDFLNPCYTSSPYFNLDVEEFPSEIHVEVTSSRIQDKAPATEDVRRTCLEKLKLITSGIYGATDSSLGSILQEINVLEDLVTKNQDKVQGLPIKHHLKPKRRAKTTMKSDYKKRLHEDHRQEVQIDGLFNMDMTPEKLSPPMEGKIGEQLDEVAKEKVIRTETLRDDKDIMTDTVTHLKEETTSKSTNQKYIELDKIWMSVRKDRTLGKVGPFTISSKSIQSLKSQLTDEVLDAYMHLLCKKHDGAAHINSVFGTAIFDDNMQVHGLLTQMDLYSMDSVITAINENGNHWTLLIILPKTKSILYINPLGETDWSEQKLLQNWYAFLKRRFEMGVDKNVIGLWQVTTPNHAKQNDSVSCGVYVLKIAEEFLSGRRLNFIFRKEDIVQYRRHIALSIMANTVAVQEITTTEEEKATRYSMRRDPKKKQKPGFTYQTREKFCLCEKPDDGRLYWQCDQCNVWYHPECIGKDMNTEPQMFKCHNCQMSFLSLPDHIITEILQWTVMMSGDSAYRTLSLVSKKFMDICSRPSFRRQCHMMWLQSIKPMSFWVQEKNRQFFNPFKVAVCEGCGRSFKEEGPGFWGGKGRQGQFIGWYDELSHPGYCGMVCWLQADE